MTETIYLSSPEWGNIVVNSKEEKEFFYKAHKAASISANLQSWVGGWLYPAMEKEYCDALDKAKIECKQAFDKMSPEEQKDLRRFARLP